MVQELFFYQAGQLKKERHSIYIYIYIFRWWFLTKPISSPMEYRRSIMRSYKSSSETTSQTYLVGSRGTWYSAIQNGVPRYVNALTESVRKVENYPRDSKMRKANGKLIGMSSTHKKPMKYRLGWVVLIPVDSPLVFHILESFGYVAPCRPDDVKKPYKQVFTQWRIQQVTRYTIEHSQYTIGLHVRHRSPSGISSYSWTTQ